MQKVGRLLITVSLAFAWCAVSGRSGATIATAATSSTILGKQAIAPLQLARTAAPISTAPATAPITTSSAWHWQNPLPQGNDLTAVSCPSTVECYAVGGDGTILNTTDGGTTWRMQVSGTNEPFYSISCPNPVVCYATYYGNDGAFLLTTTNGGKLWSRRPAGDAVLQVDCPSVGVCYAADPAGGFLRVLEGGATGAPHICVAEAG